MFGLKKEKKSLNSPIPSPSSSLQNPLLLPISKSRLQSLRVYCRFLTHSMALTVYPLCFLVVASLLLPLLCFSTSCLASDYIQDCSWTTCGGIEFTYPFGKLNSGCGDPQFQVRCDQNRYPLLNISGHEYLILLPSSLNNDSVDNHSITIINYNLWRTLSRGKCDPSCNYSQFWWPASHFRISHGYTNLTLSRNCSQSMKRESFKKCLLCGDDWYFNSNPEYGRRFCQTNLHLPINNNFSIKQNEDLTTPVSYGFEITWYVDTKRDRSCGACLDSNGGCGYNISEPSSTFLCYCPDGKSHPEICPANDIGNRSCGYCLDSKGSCGYNISEPSSTFLCNCPDGTSHPVKCPASDIGRKNKAAIVIGCVIGGAMLTALAVLFLTFYVKRRPPPASSTSKVEKFLKQYACEMPTRYSYSHLKKITNNFGEKLGEGGYGAVYKGKLRNGALVAVKLLDRHRHSHTQFMSEVATIGRVHHFNLVRLLGYCFENPTSALVYEYMLNGSLDKFLFAGKEEGQVLRWEQLYSIALGAARGIAYLHQECDRRIIHFDIKPHNLLLDADFTPKVADFGLAKLCGKEDDHISMTGARGTPGYVAPELCDRDIGPVTDKSDVYSFGMLLLEIVGGRKNFHWKASRSSQFYFPEWAFKLLESGELGMRLRGEGEMDAEDEEKTRKLTKVGLWCIQYNPRDRPCMTRVVQMLEGTGEDVANPPLPFDSSATPENHVRHSTVNSSSIVRAF